MSEVTVKDLMELEAKIPEDCRTAFAENECLRTHNALLRDVAKKAHAIQEHFGTHGDKSEGGLYGWENFDGVLVDKKLDAYNEAWQAAINGGALEDE